VPYETVPYTFSQIRGELAKATGNEDVTVPTLQVGETYVTDSVNVAEYVSISALDTMLGLFDGGEDVGQDGLEWTSEPEPSGAVQRHSSL